MPPPPNRTGITPTTPTTPTTPVTGNVGDLINQMQRAQQQKKSTAALRQQALQAIAQSKDPIFRRVYYKTIQPGALATFQYLYWKHDPYPLVLCSGVYQSDGRVAGINLHYLTFKYIKYLITQYCGKQFSYPLIKGNMYIYNAFRTYKRDGLRMTKMMDCNFLLALLGSVRSFSPTEIEAIRQEVQRQLRERMNPTAEETMQEYMQNLVPNPHHPRNLGVQGYEPLQRYGEPAWPRAVPPLAGPKPTLGDARRGPTNLLPPNV